MIHLHVHSEYSLRDSTIRISELVERVKELGMPAVALTDHGSMSGALEFYATCHEAGVEPIIGIELYVVSGLEKKTTGADRFHLVLLARNKEGYQNLLKIASMAGREGFYYVPRVDTTILEEHKYGLIALTGCLRSILYLRGKRGIAKMARWLQKTYPRLYLEIMPHDSKEQRQHNLLISRLSERYSIPMVATQDCHYLEDGHKEAHDVLMKIQDRPPYTVDLFLSTAKEMYNLLHSKHGYLGNSAIRESMANTYRIVKMVSDPDIPVWQESMDEFQFDFPDFEHVGV